MDLSTAATIKGATADSTWIPGGASRRVQYANVPTPSPTIVPAGAINICGLARQVSIDKIAEYEAQVKAIDPTLLASAKTESKTNYPAYNGRCAQVKDVPKDVPTAVPAGNQGGTVSAAQQSYSQSVTAAVLMAGFHMS